MTEKDKVVTIVGSRKKGKVNGNGYMLRSRVKSEIECESSSNDDLRVIL